VAVVVAAAVTRRRASWSAVRCAVFTALTLLHRLHAAGIACCWRLHHQLYEQPVQQRVQEKLSQCMLQRKSQIAALACSCCCMRPRSGRLLHGRLRQQMQQPAAGNAPRACPQRKELCG
jgi:hypothetical protein